MPRQHYTRLRDTEISLRATQELQGLSGRSLNAMKYSEQSIFAAQIQQLPRSAASCSATRKLGLPETLLMRAVVISRLGYCNFLLGPPASVIFRLKHIQTLLDFF